MTIGNSTTYLPAPKQVRISQQSKSNSESKPKTNTKFKSKDIISNSDDSDVLGSLDPDDPVPPIIVDGFPDPEGPSALPPTTRHSNTRNVQNDATLAQSEKSSVPNPPSDESVILDPDMPVSKQTDESGILDPDMPVSNPVTLNTLEYIRIKKAICTRIPTYQASCNVLGMARSLIIQWYMETSTLQRNDTDLEKERSLNRKKIKAILKRMIEHVIIWFFHFQQDHDLLEISRKVRPSPEEDSDLIYLPKTAIVQQFKRGEITEFENVLDLEIDDLPPDIGGFDFDDNQIQDQFHRADALFASRFEQRHSLKGTYSDCD